MAARRWRSCSASVAFVCSQPTRNPPQNSLDIPPIVMTEAPVPNRGERRALRAVEGQFADGPVVDHRRPERGGGLQEQARVVVGEIAVPVGLWNVVT